MQQSGIRLLVLVALCAGCVPRPREKLVRGPVRVACRRARGGIKIDGRLDEPAWADAQAVEDFLVLGTREAAKVATSARFLWDERFLYMAVSMTDRDITAAKDEHDGKLWEDDVAELFLKPDAGRHVYYEFHVNPLGTTLDLCFGRRGAGSFDRWRAWESGMRAAVDVVGTLNSWKDEDERWTVEMAIPLGAFRDALPDGRVKPRPGDEWRFAVCRYNYSVHLEDVECSSTAAFRAPSFHRHEDYDILEFAE